MWIGMTLFIACSIVVWMSTLLFAWMKTDSACLSMPLGRVDLRPHNSPRISLHESTLACVELLDSLEDQKRQLRLRLQMLDDMIEKSDREIIRLHDQLSQ